MEQEPGAASFISLSEPEQRCYSGLHSLCQADTSGKLSSGKVAELFKASQLPPESLHRDACRIAPGLRADTRVTVTTGVRGALVVTEVCGAKHLGYFGPPQFYVALKLLAAAQSGLPIHLESLTANLPLPRFVGLKNDSEARYSSGPAGGDGQGAACGTGPVSWTPADRSAFRQLEASTKKESRSPPQSPRTSSPRSPLTHRSQQRNGAEAQSAYESKRSSHGTAQLEQRSSPGRYGPKPAAERASMARTCSSEKLEQQTVEDYSDSDPWRITEEQLEYYTNQFKSLQPDLGALILGSIAKNFFTKSKLPIPELSHIWELSDVDRDGALTFSEFCTAFHLIVARKNGYPLPESLPPSLRPGFVELDEEEPETPESLKPLIVFEDAELRPSQRDRAIERLQSNLKAAKQELKEEKCSQDVMNRVVTSEEKPQRPEPPHDLDLQMRMKTRPRSYSSTSFEDAVKKAEEPPTPPPRPQKSHSRASSLDLNKLFQQGAPGVKSGWLPPPPALPPRPSTSQVSPFVSVPEKTPLKKVQQPNFADFSHFREEEESSVKPGTAGLRSRFGPSTEDLTSASKQDGVGVSHSQAPQKPVRRKYHPENQSVEAGPPPITSIPTKPAQKLQPRQRREIQMAIRKNKEANAVLTRLNSELQQQLKVVHQERVTLESQLEVLRPLASA